MEGTQQVSILAATRPTTKTRPVRVSTCVACGTALAGFMWLAAVLVGLYPGYRFVLGI